MKKNRLLRVTALFTALTFIVTNQGAMPTAHAQGLPVKAIRIHPLQVSNLKLPSKFGEVVEYSSANNLTTAGEGKSGPAVIVIQDAHAIPDAQKNIANLIKYFQQEYGVGTVALEGASGDLDPQIFKSFPDQKLMREVMKGYLDAGEIAGGTAAAIFDKTSSVYEGVEDWDLYEEALGFYLKAMEVVPALNEKLTAYSQQLTAEKEKVYSKELLAVDRAVEKFY